MAKAKQLPSGTWRALVYNGKRPDGKRDYISITAPTEPECNLLALQHELHYKEVSRDPRKMTVDEAMERYIQSKSNVLSPASIRTYGMYRRKHYGLIKQTRLSKLTQPMIQDVVNEASRICAPKTVSSIYGFLAAVLKEYHPGFDCHATLPQRRKTKDQIYTGDQIAALIDAVRGDVLEIPVLLAVWLGLRRSEIIGLRWDRVDLEKGIISIDTAMVRGEDGMVVKGTKTYSSTRDLPLPPYIASRLAGIPHHGDYIVNVTADYLLQRLYRLEEKNGLPRLGLHKLRHTNASVMLLLNIADKYAMERGGWATNYTLKYIYQHTMTDHRATVDQLIDGYFEKLITSPMQHEIQHDNAQSTGA